jgi:hypothetical protein
MVRSVIVSLRYSMKSDERGELRYAFVEQKRSPMFAVLFSSNFAEDLRIMQKWRSISMNESLLLELIDK